MTKLVIAVSFIAVLTTGVISSALAASVSAPPSNCRRGDAVEVVRDFVSAYNSHDEQQFRSTVAPPSKFGSYGDVRAFAGAVPFSTRERATLWSFIGMRQHVDERLTLDDLDVRWNREKEIWNFQFRISKTSDDILIPGGITQHGKGAFTNCKIAIWNAGT